MINGWRGSLKMHWIFWTFLISYVYVLEVHVFSTGQHQLWCVTLQAWDWIHPQPFCVLTSSFSFQCFQCQHVFFREETDILWRQINDRLLVITRGAESMCSFLIVLPEVLLLVSGEVHQVPQQERLHHGELSMLFCSMSGYCCWSDN